MANVCQHCGEDLSGPPRAVYFDEDGRKFCSRECRDLENDEDQSGEEEGDFYFGDEEYY